MEENISVKILGKIQVFEAKTDEDKRTVVELLERGDYEGLKKYVIQESVWEE